MKTHQSTDAAVLPVIDFPLLVGDRWIAFWSCGNESFGWCCCSSSLEDVISHKNKHKKLNTHGCHITRAQQKARVVKITEQIRESQWFFMVL